MTEQTPATEARPVLASFTYRDAEFKVTRKPSAFLVASLGNVDSGDPAALGVIVKFFQKTLAQDEFNRFAAVALDDDSDIEDGFTALAEALQSVVEQTMGRPTK